MGRRRKQNIINLYKDHAELIVESKKHGTFKILIDKRDVALIDNITWRIWAPATRPRYGPYVVGYDTELKKAVKLHRVILKAPRGTSVDHINRDGLDNRRVNLRFCTNSENQANRTHNFSNKAALKGVRIGKSGMFNARLFKRKPTRVSFNTGFIFKTPEEAGLAYNDLAIQHLGTEHALLNDVENYIRTPAVLKAIKRQSLTLSQRGTGRRRNKTTGYYGVYYRPAGTCKSTDCYEARAKFESKPYYWGLYDTAEEAALVADKKSLEIYPEFTHLNFPENSY
jgi:hypothetical protein